MKAPYQIKRRQVTGSVLNSRTIYVFTLICGEHIIYETSSHEPVPPASMRKFQATLNTKAIMNKLGIK